jgi:hypothetical protein
MKRKLGATELAMLMLDEETAEMPGGVVAIKTNITSFYFLLCLNSLERLSPRSPSLLCLCPPWPSICHVVRCNTPSVTLRKPPV